MKGSGPRQATLPGLWKREQESNEKSKRKTSRTYDAVSYHKCDDNNGVLFWENKSLVNGPMLLLRGAVGGSTSTQRKNTKEALSSLPDWDDSVTFNIYGKECCMRRRICQYSSSGDISYSYSGLKNVVAPQFPMLVYEIKCQVEDLMLNYFLDNLEPSLSTGIKHFAVPPEFMALLRAIRESRNDPTSGERSEIFNYCLLNHYRNGEEYMSYHTDDESSLHPHCPIASVSLGSTRNFDIRQRKKGETSTKRCRLDRIPLGDGDLLLMFHPMQENYEHCIPVEKRVVGDRINLTFRRVNKR
ncbi:hypothetical protein HJC23_007607 [Cyclotella cryptica]|uniref:Fe2OG dioxygenase domain-containing protein n=1 Tax=Cyclotella cryptica TaxID=29204 RepID=A0ABD3QXR8_9STRA